MKLEPLIKKNMISLYYLIAIEIGYKYVRNFWYSKIAYLKTVFANVSSQTCVHTLFLIL